MARSGADHDCSPALFDERQVFEPGDVDQIGWVGKPLLHCRDQSLAPGKEFGLRRAGKILGHNPDARSRHARTRQQFRPAGHRRQAGRQIAHAGREHPDGIQRPRKAFDADRRQQPVRRLDRSDAAKRRGTDHRPSGLGANRKRQHAGADRGRRA